jgi:hypothetical protein
VLALPSLILIDLWYAFRPGARLGAGIAAALGMIITLLALFQQLYPVYPIANIPIASTMVLLVSLAVSLLGAALGDYFAEGNKQSGEITGSHTASLSLGVVASTAIFIIIFVVTAAPPG